MAYKLSPEYIRFLKTLYKFSLESFRRVRNKFLNPRKKYSNFFLQKIRGGNYLPIKEKKFQKYIDNNGNYQIDLIESSFVFDSSGFDIALDIGANTGLTCRPISKKYKLVFAIEPSSKNRACIGRNQSPGLNNIIIFPFAISDEIQNSKIRGSDTGCGENSLSEVDLPIANFYENVYVTTLDNLFINQPLVRNRKIGLIKLDIQGLEINALRGAKQLLNYHHPTVICEVRTPYISYEKEITNYLNSLGYKKVLSIEKDIIYIFEKE